MLLLFTQAVAAPAPNHAPEVLEGRDEIVRLGERQRVGGLFTDREVAQGPWTWEITWGDGAVTTGSVEHQVWFGGEHTYEEPGAWTVEVCVTDAAGATGCDERTITVVE